MWSAILKVVLEVILAFVERKVSEPKTIEDAATPKPIRDRWAAYLRDKLDKLPNAGGADRQPK
jgi:hypothetical protein